MPKLVLVTGASGGIGESVCRKFLTSGFEVAGFDIAPALIKNPRYRHFIVDVSDCSSFPNLGREVNILVHCAGIDKGEKILSTNLEGTIAVNEHYGIQDKIESIVFVASASARTGAENPVYAASKGGMVAYMKNTASRIAGFGATANSISPGGVKTKMNQSIMDDPEKWAAVLAETMTGRWAEADEIAEWIYFTAAVNKSMTAQDILIDNGEEAKFNFIE